MPVLLEVKNLSVSFWMPEGELQAVRDVSFSLKAGEVLAIVGESGCGKSVLCKTILKLLPPSAKIKSGSICVNGIDITGYREREMCRLRGKLFSMVFQDPMTTLHPSMTVGTQIGEAVKVHQPGMTKAALQERVEQLMRFTGIDRPKERMQQYPHHLSGGMRQRCVLAIALACEPDILFADEPTTALDVTIQAQILELIADIQKKSGMAVVFVTHDLRVAAKVADRVAVMYAGKIVEIGTAQEIFYDPRHPYTWGLMQAMPACSRGKDTLQTIPGISPVLFHPPKGDAFACRNVYALGIDYEQEPPMFPVSKTHQVASWLLDERAPKISTPILHRKLTECGNLPVQDTNTAANEIEKSGEKERLLDVRHLTCRFLFQGKNFVSAVDDVSFHIDKGEIFGLVGESGCGKSTMARCIMNVCQPDSGSIVYKGINICDAKAFRKNRKLLQRSRQLIFQDSASSLDPHMKVRDLIAEPMKIQRITPKRGSLRDEVEFLMRDVGLEAADINRYPFELSGGQKQRVAIARALSMEPELLVADEPLASLDVLIQAQIVNLFRHLKKEHGFTFLFIAHDLAMVEFLCDRVGVMYGGKLVECAPTRELFHHPQHPYTKTLLAEVFDQDKPQ